jgi:tetratricopeptide (TPR) repeat protein
MFAAASKLLRQGWDEARIERTLARAKKRRTRGKLTRGAVGLVSAALLFVGLGVAASRPSATSRSEARSSSREQRVVVQAADESSRTRESTALDVAHGSPPPVQDAAHHEQASPETRVASVHSEQLRVHSLASERATALWRKQLRAGDVGAAYEVLRARPVRLASLDDYLLAADTARRAGDPASAVTYLERALTVQHTPRSAVAAFTRGRILLDELARPADAARAFAEVERRARNAPLLEDALAREIDAWRAAGEVARAKARAALYLIRFPKGHHEARMRRLSEGSAP